MQTRALGDLLLRADELLQAKSAGVQFSLERLDILLDGRVVVAQEQSAPEPGCDDAQSPLEHRVARGLGARQLHLLDVDLVIAAGDRLEVALLHLGLGKVLVELCEVDVLATVHGIRVCEMVSRYLSV